MKKSIYLILLLIFSGVSIAHAQKNLVTNGGFEDEIDGWINYGGSVTPYDFKSGKNSCVITASQPEKWVGLHQVINIPKKTQALNFSIWLKAINVIKGKEDWNGAVYNAEFLDSGQNKVGESVTITRVTGDSDWEFASKTVKIPAGAVSVKILAAMAFASGTLFIDDVSVKAADINMVNAQ